MENFYEITINKPLHDNYCSIREKYLKEAIQQNKKLLIKIPQGEGVVDPKEWMVSGKRIEQVFLIPNKPMILYANYVPIDVHKNQATLF